VAERIVEDLAAVGIRLRVVTARTWTEYLDRAGRGDYDMAVLGWQADTPDPNDFLSALVSSSALATTNRSGYESAAMDALLEQGRRSADPRQRAVTYHEIQALFQKDMPWVPLYHVAAFTAYRRSVKGLTPGPNGLIRLERAWKSE
jgi:peptide/nickel transport system substrate-binding protein